MWTGVADTARPIAAAGMIGDRVLLTADVTDGGPLTVAAPTGTPATRPRRPATVLWKGLGAALLRVDPPVGSTARPDAAGAVRWGVLSGTGGWTTVDLDPAAGRGGPTVHPLSSDAAGLIVRPGSAVPDLPGHAAHCEELLVGVITTGDDGGPRVVPVEWLARDPAFVREVDRATGRRFVGELLPLLPVLRPWSPPGPAQSPAELLSAEHEVVGYLDRPAVRDRLAGWCHSGAALSALVLEGPSGSGTTRTARELAADLQPHWAAGMLSEAPPDDWLTTVRSADRPLLLVVDGPHRRRDQLSRLLLGLAERTAAHPVRVLITAATLDGWHAPLRAATDSVGQVWEPDPLRLGPLEPDEVRHLWGAAVAAFAGHPAVPEAAVPPPSPGPFGAALPDAVLRAALAAALGHGRDVDDHAVLVEREQRHWSDAADRHGVPGGRDRRRALVAALLCPPRTQAAGRSRLEAVGGDVRYHLERYASWLTAVHPPQDPQAWHWAGPAPTGLRRDALAALVSAADVEPVLTALPADDAATTLSILASLAGAAGPHDPGVVASAADVIRPYPDDLGPAAVAVAAAEPGALPLLAALHTDVRDGTLPTERCRKLAHDLPDELAAVAGLAADVAGRLIAGHRPDTDGPQLLARAAALAARADLALDRPAAALPHADLAADHYRAAVGQPFGSVFRPSFVGALRLRAQALRLVRGAPVAVLALLEAAAQAHRLGAATAEVGRATVAAELLALCATLLDEPVPDLDAAHAAVVAAGGLVPAGTPLAVEADRLTGWGHLLSGSGAEAIDCLRRAADGYRTLAERSPALYGPTLAGTLDQLATALAAVGDAADAVGVGEEALHRQRQAADRAPGRATAALVRMLVAQATRLALDRRPRPALDLAAEAVRHADDLHRAGGAGLRDLDLVAAAANALSLRFAGLGDAGGARPHARRAVAAYTRLADAGGSAQRYGERLAAALHNEAVVLLQAGPPEAAADAARRSVQRWRDLAGPDPRYRPDLAAALHNAALAERAAAESDSALLHADEAVEVYERLDPAVGADHADFHAAALETLLDLAAERGHPEAALKAASDLVELRRRAGGGSEAEQRRFAAALDRYADLSRDQPRPDWAAVLDAADSAAHVYDRLVARDPMRYTVERGHAWLTAASAQAALGRTDEAVRGARVAVAALDAGGSGRLAEALDLLSAWQAQEGNDVAAAVSAGRLVAVREREADRPELVVRALLVLADRQTAAGQRTQAARTAERATREAHGLLVREPSAVHHELFRTALWMLAEHQRTAGSTGDAVLTLRRLLTLLGDPAADVPGADLPELARTAGLLADLERRERQFAQSLGHQATAVAAYDRLAAGDASYARDHGEASLMLARWLEAEGDHAGALDALRGTVLRLRQLLDADKDIRPLLVDVLRLLAEERYPWRRRAERRLFTAELDRLGAG